MFFKEIVMGIGLVWLLWQPRVSIDLQWGKFKNGIYCQAIADMLTKLL